MQQEAKWLMDYLDQHDVMPDMTKTVKSIKAYVSAHHKYESKNRRLSEWTRNISCFFDQHFYELTCHIFIGALMHPEGMTYQAMIGYIQGNITCESPLDRAKCAAEIIAIAYQCDLITITKITDDTMMITTEYELDVDIPEFQKHLPRFKKPEPIGYNPILGNIFKQHNKDVCTDHIDRMNAIPLCLEQRVVTGMQEATSSDLETQEQIDQWEDFERRSREMYFEIYARGNIFHLNHSVDTRGRTYCEGYYVTYQGSSYKKAIVQLANKEVVKL